ncbi:MAG: T9SS type A sorting domain-containing protein [Ignavibacteria bacterium]|nr:T9SS type A sorting domain-containing protein [Ignavibacteria bacterium]
MISSPDSSDYEIGDHGQRIGDVNADGFDDYLLSGSFGAGVGMAFLYLGSSRGMESKPIATVWNPQSGMRFSYEAINVGDIDGDGIKDFAANYVYDIYSGFALFAGKSWKRTPVYDVPYPHTPSIAAFPNPFHDYSTIVINGALHENAVAVVYDTYGRVVRKFVLDDANSTTGHIRWDGCNAFGVNVPSGIYFISVQSHNEM